MALAGLNWKIKFLQNKCNSLNRQIDNLVHELSEDCRRFVKVKKQVKTR